jgi:hypothetical protein
MAANGPWITSQAGGNQTSSNQLAMTAPGTQPVDHLADRVTQADPTVTPIGKPRSVIVDGNASPSPAPWTSADGSPWKSSSDDEYLPPRMMPARGQWNEV